MNIDVGKAVDEMGSESGVFQRDEGLVLPKDGLAK